MIILIKKNFKVNLCCTVSDLNEYFGYILYLQTHYPLFKYFLYGFLLTCITFKISNVGKYFGPQTYFGTYHKIINHEIYDSQAFIKKYIIIAMVELRVSLIWMKDI